MFTDCTAVSFNPRARTGRDVGSESTEHPWRFNPRARTGRDRIRLDISSTCRVSIHAPVRGATERFMQSDAPICVFQSTRPYGARRDVSRADAPHRPEFQSTRPYGARPAMSRRDHRPTSAFQSTRPYGARRVELPGTTAASNCFNPRARTGRDAASSPAPPWSSFNPRARTGRDARRWRASALRRVSIHAPVRGATSTVDPTIRASGVFQSTRPYGARL